MALKALMAKKKLDDATAQLEALRTKQADFAKREADLEIAIAEATTEEEQKVVEENVAQFEIDKEANENEIKSLSERVAQLEQELADCEVKQDAPAPEAVPVEARSNETIKEMNCKMTFSNVRTAKVFGKMNDVDIKSMIEREDVRKFNAEVRDAMANKRAISNVGLTIPEVYLGLIRENIENYSKLYKYVNVKALKGTGRMTVMGTYPEAVWTEACANLNELDLTFNNVEVDGYKVGGFIAVCNANLEDSELDLDAEIIIAIGQSIGIAVDKAILYGTGVKMPQGIVPRLVQTEEPANYPANARPWVDLHTTNVKSISSSLEGITLFKELIVDSGAAKGKYSRGQKVWCMNETTYTQLMAEATSINAAGAIVSGVNGTMPIIGGDIVVLDFIPANVIIGGYFDLYLLAERSGAKLGQSEHVKFTEDETVFKGTARYDGLPVIAEGFVAFALNSGSVSGDMSFPEDEANPQ